MTLSTVVFTDGACERNPGGRGGWGWVVDENTFGLGGDPSTTNQRMEIRAALEAVYALPPAPTGGAGSPDLGGFLEENLWGTLPKDGRGESQEKACEEQE